MPIKPLTLLVCLLVATALVLPACGGDDGAGSQPASESLPADQAKVLDKRMRDIERAVGDLRREVKSLRAARSSADESASDTPTDQTGSTGDTGTGMGAASDAGSPSGSGSGAGGIDAGGGPDPGSSEGKATVEDICGKNPAPNC